MTIIIFNRMGNPNSKSSMKQNNSLVNSINFINSQQFSNAQNSGKSLNKQPDVLTKFSWTHGGNQVLLTGSFNRWKQTIPLEKRGQQFSITILLPRGLHYYKFIVDGQWRFSPEDSFEPDNRGNINNFIDTTNFHHLIEKKKSSSGQIFKHNKVTNYSPTDERDFNSTVQFNKEAPKLSPHYEKCQYLDLQSNIIEDHCHLSNHSNHSTQIDKMQNQVSEYIDFQQSLTPEEVRFLFNSYHCLQPPSHATLDHLITEKPNQNNYTSMAVTQRFKSKYTTYKYFTVGKAK